METCEMCGARTKLYNCVVEGADLLVCEGCSRFGKVVGVFKPKAQAPIIKKKPKKQIEIEFEVIEGFAILIKNLREKQSLRQDELALKINEKASLIHGLESGHLTPSFGVVEKLERFFRVRLIEKVDSVASSALDLKDQALTIGDLIKIRKSRNQDS